MYTIYALIDPRDYTTRYIGITNDVYARFRQHLGCDGGNPQKDAWIEELKQAQAMLIMKTLEVVDAFEQAIEREKHWIHYHRFLGANLLNLLVPTIRLASHQDISRCEVVGAYKHGGGRQSNYDRVQWVILYKHQHGDWPNTVSADMQRWYQKQYFTVPNKKWDGERYEKHKKAYDRGRQWIEEYENMQPIPPYIKRGPSAANPIQLESQNSSQQARKGSRDVAF